MLGLVPRCSRIMVHGDKVIGHGDSHVLGVSY